MPFRLLTIRSGYETNQYKAFGRAIRSNAAGSGENDS